MATRYWVGGVGTWNTSSTTNWSASSGGAGGASVPTSADDVVIDTSSGTGLITCTGAVCLSLTVTATQSITLGSTSSTLSVYGNLTFPSTGSFSASTNSWTCTLAATTTGNTVNTGTKSFSSVTFNGTGGEWTVNTALTCISALTLTAGSLNTNGQSVSIGTFNTSGTTTRSLTLGASSFTLTGDLLVSATTNFTLTANTSTITLSGSGATFTGGGLTYYNVSFTSTSATSHTITGANTFNNLLFTSPASSGFIKIISLAANQTINGTLTANGGSEIRRFFIRSDTLGTPRTITAAAESLSNCDFRDITAAGAASPFTGTSFGDCLGNSNITFTASKTVYWNLSGSQNWSSTGWATSSGGSPSSANFPLAQDTCIFDDAGASTTVTINNSWNIGTINMSGRTSAMTLTTSVGSTIYGDLTFGSGVTSSGNQSFSFSGRTTQTITTAGKTFTFPITVDSPGGTVQLNGNYTSNLNVTLPAITVTRGTFDAVSYDLYIPQFSSSNSNTRTINMGSGTWTLYGISQIWTTNTLTNLTLNKQTSNIIISDTSASGKSFISGNNSLSFPKISFYLAGYTLTFTNSISIDELVSIPFSTANTITFATSAANTVGTWSVKGVSGTVPSITSATSGTTATVNVTNKTTSDIDYLSFRDITCTTLDPVTFFVGSNSTNVSNNKGIAFTTTNNVIHVLTSGTSWTVPSGFNSTSNTIHLFGGGGGGSNASVSGNNRAAGGGGGGGGYTQVSNLNVSTGTSVAVTIGAAGTTSAAGGTTTLINNPITYIADDKTQNSSTGNSLVINKPTGTAQGDLLVAFITDNGSATTYTPPAGWSTGVATSNNRACFYLTAGASEPSSYTFTSNTSAGIMQGYILTYRNAAWDVGGTVGSGASPAVAPSITLTTSYSLVLGHFSNTANGSITFTTPSNYTAVDSNSDATAPSSAIFSRVLYTSGATGTVSSTPSSLTARGYLVGIKGTGTVYSAGGGTQGGASSTGPTSTAGTGGVGSTYNGGAGGVGSTSTVAGTGNGGGGGGGAGGPNGVGGTGGIGFASTTTANIAGGGGGGNGGGTNGGNASSALGGDGGNNSLGTGGATGGSGVGAAGNFGGGGAGGAGSSTSGRGGSGIEILSSFGGAGGSGGSPATAATGNTISLYGGGGGGGGVATSGAQQTGGNGSQGAIIIVYASGGSFSESITESISTGDTNAVVLTLNATVTEDMSVASVESVLAAFFLNLTETITANDGQVANLATATSVTESFDISTLISGGIAANASVTENSGLDALNTELVVFSGVVTENVGIADAMSVVGAFSTSIAEALGINDVRQANAAFPAVMVEALVVDSAEAAASAFAAVMVENTTLDDIRVIGSAYFDSLVENVSLDSVQSGILTFIASVVENVNPDNNQSVTVAFSASIAEPVTMQDNQPIYGWFRINDDQTANWAVISSSTSANWSEISNTQDGNWQVIDNEQR